MKFERKKIMELEGRVKALEELVKPKTKVTASTGPSEAPATDNPKPPKKKAAVKKDAPKKKATNGRRKKKS